MKEKHLRGHKVNLVSILVRVSRVKDENWDDLITQALELLDDAISEATHCQKDIEESKAVCGVKLDCHLHDR